MMRVNVNYFTANEQLSGNDRRDCEDSSRGSARPAAARTPVIGTLSHNHGQMLACETTIQQTLTGK